MFAGIASIGRRYAERRRQRRAYHELSALDDRMLKDLGVHRSQIGTIVRGTDRPYRGGR